MVSRRRHQCHSACHGAHCYCYRLWLPAVAVCGGAATVHLTRTDGRLPATAASPTPTSQQPPHGGLHISWSDCAGTCKQGVCMTRCVRSADSRCACDAAAAVAAGMPPGLAPPLQPSACLPRSDAMQRRRKNEGVGARWPSLTRCCSRVLCRLGAPGCLCGLQHPCKQCGRLVTARQGDWHRLC
jgi:hypothetical protein